MGKPILIVQGAQWGSEAKGAVAGWLCNYRRVDIAVRTGATNAGHTVVHSPDGRASATLKMQQLPVGFVSPRTTLVIGAGALIDPAILDREVELINAHLGGDVRKRLKIDYRAALHVPAHAVRSKSSGRHHAIGATGKGCSEALIDRIKGRGDPSYKLFIDSPYADGYDVCDTEEYLNNAWDTGAQILLEGTQGQMLDLYLGPYPYTTHKQTGPAQWMLECGLSPALPTEIVMVARTFPIRVAGNSGPMPQEISWPTLAREVNEGRRYYQLAPIVQEDAINAFEDAVRHIAGTFHLPLDSEGLDQHTWTSEERIDFQVALSELHKMALESMTETDRTKVSHLFEMTTVTKKLRRIARLDRQQLEISARQMRPAWVALTFMNYMYPQNWFKVPEEPSSDERELFKWTEEVCGAPVRLATYGPADQHVAVVGNGF